MNKFRPINVSNSYENKPEPLDFILSGFVKGTVGIIYGKGGTGKGFGVMEIAMSVCCNDADKELLNMGIEKEGEVVIFDAEDPEVVLQGRIHSIGLKLTQEMKKNIIEKLDIRSTFGDSMNILDKSIQDEIKKIAYGKRLIVFDSFIRWHRLNENDNSKMSQILGVFEMIAKESGAAVLIVHHASKNAGTAGFQENQNSTRGASAIVDNCRWQVYMQTMTEEEAKKLKVPLIERKNYVQIGGSKQNYDELSDPKWLKRSLGGVLIPVDINIIKKIQRPELCVVKKEGGWKEKIRHKVGNYYE